MMWRELGLYTVPYKYGGHTVYGASVYRNHIDKIYILAVRYGTVYGTAVIRCNTVTVLHILNVLEYNTYITVKYGNKVIS